MDKHRLLTPPHPPEVARILPCGCWVVFLAQTKADEEVVLCSKHEVPVLETINDRGEGWGLG